VGLWYFAAFANDRNGMMLDTDQRPLARNKHSQRRSSCIQPPFWSENNKELFDKIINDPIKIDDELLTDDAKDLITKVCNPCKAHPCPATH
jgi:hypothetical protein